MRELTASSKADTDRQLVDRCLKGDPTAWDTMYHLFHHGLMASVKLLLGPGAWDKNLVEEIVARVWYALVSRDGEVLDRFDPSRGCRLSTYLAQLARSEISRFFRSERRRRNRERTASKSGPNAMENQWESELEEFLETLTPREKEFCANVLLGESPESLASFSSTNAWKLQSRIRGKLRGYLSTQATLE
ncbi:MAG: sigma-70 family RNA polymerase sigma factor [Planctomycetes bacterium]|nr:sigma-70 family RNA polymerase sigma factor [Planctomycetota bacterium]